MPKSVKPVMSAFSPTKMNTGNALPGRARKVSHVVMALGALALAGCSSLPEMGSIFENDPVKSLKSDLWAKAKSAPMALQVGDQFTFDNPDITWTVSEVQADRVLWKSSGGEDQSTALNPLLPALSWSSQRRGTGTRLLSAIDGDLFPLEEGDEMRFRATVDTDRPPYAWEFDWLCRTGKEGETRIPAGVFRTQKVACGRDGQSELVFDYAPELGYYVQMEIANPQGGEAIVRSLTGYRVAAYEQMQTQIAMMEEKVKSKGQKAPKPQVAVVADAKATATAPETMMVDKPMAAGKVGMVATMEMADEKEGMMAASGEAAMMAKDHAKAADHKAEMKSDGMGMKKGLELQTMTMEAPKKAEAMMHKGGMYRAHLASYKKKANVDRGWRIHKLKLKGMLDQLTQSHEKVTVKGKGDFYRLYASSFKSLDAAKAFCREVKRKGLYCKAMK